MNQDVVILRLAVRLLYPVILFASVWLLLRGHNAPGGGFIGGMTAVAATILAALSVSSQAALDRLPGGAMRLAAAGVLIALLSGLPGLAVGAYMTHLWATLPLGFTELKVSTVLLFDLGVYLAVWGSLGGLCAHAIGLDEDSP